MYNTAEMMHPMNHEKTFRREIAVPRLYSNLLESTYPMFYGAEQSAVNIRGDRGTYTPS